MPPVGLLLCFLTLLFGGTSIASSWPPSVDSSQVATWSMSLVGITVCLIGSRISRRVRDRMIAGAGVFFGLLAFCAPTIGYLGSYHDYPWEFLLPVILLATLGAWLARLQAISVAVVVFLVWGFWGAMFRPSGPGPVSVSQGELTATLTWAPPRPDISQGVSITLTSTGSEDIETKYDLEYVEIEGRSAPLAPIEVWPATPFRYRDRKRDRVELHARSFVPSWVAGWDAELLIQPYPKPTMSASFELPRAKARRTIAPPPEVSSKSLHVQSVIWVPDQADFGFAENLVARVHVLCPPIENPPGGVARYSFRFRDESGSRVRHRNVNPSAQESAAGYWFLLDDIPLGSKRLTVDIFDSNERSAKPIRFRFPNVTSRDR